MDNINDLKDIKLNKIIHERARLLIMTILAKNENKKISFNELKELSNLTSGNLSIQLKKLEEAEYVKINKYFKNKKPFTEIELTEKGQKELEEYLSEIEKIILNIKEE